MTDGSNYEVSLREQQVAMSLLAHAARNDVAAVGLSLQALDEASDELRATHVIAALMIEFQKGMDEEFGDQLAEHFSDAAHALAAEASGIPPSSSSIDH